jgi:hypothetical protein
MELTEINNIINRLERYAYKNYNGFTICLKNNKINKVKPSNKKRYCIGVKKPLIERYQNKVIYYHENFKLIQFNNYIGGYYDKDKELFIIELILILSEKQKSINTGKFYGQYSIYDLLENKEIILSKC